MFSPDHSASHAVGNQTQGFSLVELMVSILLGVVMSLGFVKLYLESKRNYVAEEDQARLQENGRFAVNILKRELMHAGFYAGSYAAGDREPVGISQDCVATGLWALDTREAIEIIDNYSGSVLTHLGTAFSNTCIDKTHITPGTDVLSVKRTAGEATLSNGVYKNGVREAKRTQWYLRVASSGSGLSWWYNDEQGFPSTDAGPAAVADYWEYFSQVFYIRQYSVAPGDGTPALCVARLSGDGMSTECLVEGVEDMQLTFGIDTSGDGIPNEFRPVPATAGTEQTTVARVHLLLRGLQLIAGYQNRKSYRLGSKTIAAKNDAYLRRVLTTTVQIRNATSS
ncbi:MAG: PilW family protein [Halioglobus sp.]